MKITKFKLKQIIQEELQHVLNEQAWHQMKGHGLPYAGLSPSTQGGPSGGYGAAHFEQGQPASSAVARPLQSIPCGPGQIEAGEEFDGSPMCIDKPSPKKAPGVAADEPAGCPNENILHDAYALYTAMKGLGTDEEAIYRILDDNDDPQCMIALYNKFEEVLEQMKDTEDGTLVDWLDDDGEFSSARLVISRMRDGGGEPEWEGPHHR